MLDAMDGQIHWHHIIIASILILGVACLFSMETGKPIDAEGVTVDATSILIMGG